MSLGTLVLGFLGSLLKYPSFHNFAEAKIRKYRLILLRNDISELRFYPSQTLDNLRRISKGAGTDLDIKAMRVKLRRNERKLRKAVNHLTDGPPLLSDALGSKLADEVNQLAWDKGISEGLRDRIKASAERSDPRDRQGAADLLREITLYNTNTGAMLDKVTAACKACDSLSHPQRHR